MHSICVIVKLMSNQKGITTIVFIIGVLTLSVIIIGGCLYFKNNLFSFFSSNKNNQQNLSSQTQTDIVNQPAQIKNVITAEEIRKRQRDSFRLADITALQSAIEEYIQIGNNNKITPSLCLANPPCKGSSMDPSPNVKAIDGTGWVKINLVEIIKYYPTLKTLPLDPTNDQTYHYTYATNLKGTSWEIEALLESDEMRSTDKLLSNKSNYSLKNGLYKVGNDLTILP